MTSVLVIDQHDDVSDTARINALHDVGLGVVVAHAPPRRDALWPEILRALDLDLDPYSHTQTRCASLAQAWLTAHENLLLIVYGAWRAIEHDYASELSAIAGMTGTFVVFYSHSGAEAENRRLAELVDHEWDVPLLIACTRDRAQHRPAQSPSDTLDGLVAEVSPWPYILADFSAPISRGQLARLNDLFRQGTTVLGYASAAHIARSVISGQQTAAGRKLAFAAATHGALSRGRVWLTFHDDLLELPWTPVANPHVRLNAEPGTVLGRLLADVRDISAISPDGAEILTWHGRPVRVPVDFRAASRAARWLMLRNERLRVAGATTQRMRGVADDLALLGLWRYCELHSLTPLPRGSAPGSPAYPPQLPDAEGRLVLDIPHAAMIRHLAGTMAMPRTTAQPARSVEETHRVVRDLARGGLIWRDHDGEVQLTDWLADLLRYRRVVAADDLPPNRLVLSALTRDAAAS